uniref:Tetratricopeptide repeat domain 16 n=1 Tax=Ursus maritimus TaxID=29073 RepID=A0A452SZC0_URSMA
TGSATKTQIVPPTSLISSPHPSCKTPEEIPKGTLQRIFGSSQVFQNLDDVKPKVTGLTVPLKVREYYHQGLQCLEKEDWEMAVLFFSRALHLDSQLVDFYALRAEAYIQLCDFSSAAQNLRRAYSFQPENTKYLERLTLVLYLQGQCLFEQRAFREALKVFLQASALQPEKASFRYRCMACLLALEQHQDCLSLVTKEVKLGTTNADVFILRARLYNFFQKPSLCYRDLHSALLLDPKHPQAKALLQTMVDQAQQARQDAGILAVQGKLQHALQCINCAIENNPLDPSLFLFRGTVHRRLQEFDAAVEDFLKALDMLSESQEGMVRQAQRQLLLTYNDFAVHCYLQGAYQEAVLLLNKALKDEQQEKGLYINRGDCFFQLGNLTFAEADYQQALALSPQDEGANLRMGLLQEKMGFCEQRSRQFNKAESHFSMAIRHNPQKAAYYLHRARSRQLLQNILGARLDVATVLLLNPKQPKVPPLMASLFPGMPVEEVLCSRVAHLARLQLDQVLESSLQAGIPQGIVGQVPQVGAPGPEWEMAGLPRARAGGPARRRPPRARAGGPVRWRLPRARAGGPAGPKPPRARARGPVRRRPPRARPRAPAGPKLPRARAGGPARRRPPRARAGAPAGPKPPRARAWGPARRRPPRARAGGPARQRLPRVRAGVPARQRLPRARAEGPARRRPPKAQDKSLTRPRPLRAQGRGLERSRLPMARAGDPVRLPPTAGVGD